MPLPLSVLDLAPIPTGADAGEALRRTVDLARLADRLGYTRLWFAEHHGMPSVASSAPEILIAHTAAATERIRVGSGGVMLPNHAPLLVAERFHTLEALFPGRIDLGIGRAPGTDPAHIRALRSFDAEQFPYQLAELTALSEGAFAADHPFASVRVTPGGVALPPIWLLGSSGSSAAFAGARGLGYAFASHFSPTPAAPALNAYRAAFEPSEAFPEPHAVLAVAAVCAETEAEARRVSATMELAWARIRTGRFDPLPSPEEALAHDYTPPERAAVEAYRQIAVVGTPDAVRAEIERRAAAAGADEVMVTTNAHGHADRLRSYELLAEAFGLAAPPAERAADLAAAA
ncbi:LLM class flavin-dependent oxidoreductase [Rubrivirga sp. S365]|uniref:LLM class flavin-dependent oxidoreductase n=1 Tax=Rubrivirga sp. S365 TaxID=3076080 RepID=UPI0028C6ED5B|nr:LLM class flavin-dependent oxidoreductase [Rubrivirga sp. S365]MDT7855945.1 LLM class flavin-dependent oxidoreductase [Rubrivirga sp. S365]